MVAELDIVLRLEPVREALADLERTKAVSRLYDRDASLWSGDASVQAKIRDRLGWLDAATGNDDWRKQLTDLAAAAQADGLSHVVLAGMGGSSLAPEVFSLVFRRWAGYPRGRRPSLTKSDVRRR